MLDFLSRTLVITCNKSLRHSNDDVLPPTTLVWLRVNAAYLQVDSAELALDLRNVSNKDGLGNAQYICVTRNLSVIAFGAVSIDGFQPVQRSKDVITLVEGSSFLLEPWSTSGLCSSRGVRTNIVNTGDFLISRRLLFSSYHLKADIIPKSAMAKLKATQNGRRSTIRQELVTSGTTVRSKRERERLESASGAACTEILKVVNETLPFDKASYILDMGCGNGQVISRVFDSETHAALIPDNARLVAADVSQQFLDLLLERKKERSKNSSLWERLEVHRWDARGLKDQIQDGEVSHLLASFAYFSFREEKEALAEAHHLAASSWKQAWALQDGATYHSSSSSSSLISSYQDQRYTGDRSRD